MFIKDLNDCPVITAGDNTQLRVILHPDQDPLKLSYSFSHAVVKSGETTYEHLLTSSEVYYILQGEGIMHINNKDCPVKAQQAVFIPPESRQCITCTSQTDLVFLCIVDPPWKAEDETVF